MWTGFSPLGARLVARGQRVEDLDPEAGHLPLVALAGLLVGELADDPPAQLGDFGLALLPLGGKESVGSCLSLVERRPYQATLRIRFFFQIQGRRAVRSVYDQG